MNKIILLISIALATITKANGQTIFPIESNEFCPLVNTTFTVTIPLIRSGTGISLNVVGPSTIVTGVTSLNSSNGNTTFTFVGRFSDFNQTQSFRVDWYDNSNTPRTKTFEFKKIKSLTLFSPQSKINTNIPEIRSEICQITTHNINFTNIRFGNSDGSVSAFGSAINLYEYLLPAGWLLNGIPSTGAWMTSSSNVTVTSTLTTGDGGSVQIRALNTDCGVTLSKSPFISLQIIRSKPALTFNAQTLICSTSTFQANNVPAWVNNTLWSTTQSGIVSIATPTSNPTTFSKVGNGVANVQFTINGGASCPLSFNYNTLEIVNDTKIDVGAPNVTWPEVLHPTTNCLPMGFNVTYTSTSQVHAWYEWGYYEGPSGNGSPYVLINGAYTSQQPIRILNNQTINRISVKGVNACGAGASNIREFTFTAGCDGGGDVEYDEKHLMTPKKELDEIAKDKFEILGNPAYAVLNVKIPKSNEVQQILITDVNGRQFRAIRNINSNIMKIEILDLKAGLYFITLASKNKKQVLKFIKQ